MPFQGGGGAGANTALSNLASVAINKSLLFDADSTYDVGDSTNFVANLFADKIHLVSDVETTIRFASNSFIFKRGSSNVNIKSESGNFYLINGLNNEIYIGPYCRLDGFTSFYTNLGTTKLGKSNKYWPEGYISKIFLNSTATIDGSTAGHLKFVGDLVPVSDDTEWIGEIGTPFKAIKGLVIKDTTDGKHYKVEVINGTITATALD